MYRALAVAVSLLAAASPASAHWRGGYHRGYHHGGYYRGGGFGIGAGLATGLIVGGAIASASNNYSREDYCVQRFHSYDPDTGTYLGNDGRRHAC